MIIRFEKLLALMLFILAIHAIQLLADTVRSRAQIALDNVQIAMMLHADEHDGRLPMDWTDFSPYLEQDAVDEFSKIIKILTSPGDEVYINGRRLLAISRVPRSDGVFEVIQLPLDVRGVAGATREQLREAGFDLSSINPSLNDLSSLSYEALDRNRKSESDSGNLPSKDREVNASKESNDRNYSPVVVIIMILIALLIVVIIWHFRMHRKG